MHLRNLQNSVLVLVSAFVLVACAHESSFLKNEPKALAIKFGYPGCKVSTPIDPDELLLKSQLMGIGDLESSDEWVKVLALTTPGDQLRHVNCLGLSGKPSVGDNFFGLFRGEELLFRFGTVLWD